MFLTPAVKTEKVSGTRVAILETILAFTESFEDLKYEMILTEHEAAMAGEALFLSEAEGEAAPAPESKSAAAMATLKKMKDIVVAFLEKLAAHLKEYWAKAQEKFQVAFNKIKTWGKVSVDDFSHEVEVLNKVVSGLADPVKLKTELLKVSYPTSPAKKVLSTPSALDKVVKDAYKIKSVLEQTLNQYQKKAANATQPADVTSAKEAASAISYAIGTTTKYINLLNSKINAATKAE